MVILSWGERESSPTNRTVSLSSPSSSSRDLRQDGIDTRAILGTSVLETSPYPTVTMENSQSRLWHSLYPQAEGECIQLRFYLSDEQMKDTEITLLSHGNLSSLLDNLSKDDLLVYTNKKY